MRCPYIKHFDTNLQYVVDQEFFQVPHNRSSEFYDFNVQLNKLTSTWNKSGKSEKSDSDKLDTKHRGRWSASEQLHKAGKRLRTTVKLLVDYFFLPKETPQREHFSFLSMLKLSVYERVY
jgi:hypothetical protein